MAVPIATGPDFAPGTPIPLFQPRAHIGGLGVGTFYDVAPDGRFLDQHLRRTHITAGHGGPELAALTKVPDSVRFRGSG